MEDLEVLWNDLLLSVEGQISKSVYGALISSAKPLSLIDGCLRVAVPNEVVRAWLAENSSRLLMPNRVSRVEFEVGPKELFETPLLERSAQLSLPVTSMPEALAGTPKSLLNPKYVFENFVVGHNNRFAQAASLAVAEAPAKAYNPLFLYGGVGLGKTHLMQAIGHHVMKNMPQVKVLYVTCEKFTNDLINAIRYGSTADFRNRYRDIDILLVDDIQFLAGKESTKEEFFHTFNSLYEASKQIVLSSDRPPKEIPNLEERLRSRFEWGLTADIQSPDLETRLAILKKKAELEEISVPEEVLGLIAEKITSNIRELEGALIRIVAYSALTSEEITLASADEIIRDIISPKKDRPAVTIALIKKATAEYYSVKIDDMTAKIRTKEIANARQVAMFLARELTSASLPKIGEEFGGRDHTTVLYAYEKIKDELRHNPEIETAVKEITASIKKEGG